MGRDNLTMHPAFLQRALDQEADAWAAETGLAAWVATLVSDDTLRATLLRMCRNMFVEGLYRGACNVIDGKALRFAVPANTQNRAAAQLTADLEAFVKAPVGSVPASSPDAPLGGEGNKSEAPMARVPGCSPDAPLGAPLGGEGNT